MSTYKTKSLDDLEQRMRETDPDSFRQHVLKSAKDFKTSWIELGRALYTVWKDKLYKEWGYSTIDTYAAKEIGIRKQTAMKLLRSYSFLEKEEPQYLKSDYADSQDAALVPGYESIDVLRQAKNKKDLDSQDYAGLKKAVFEKGKDVQEVKKDLTNFIRQRRELEPEEARQEKRLSVLKRFLGSLKAITRELETAKLGSASLVKEADSLIKKIEAEINL
ncbi:MAG: hypothetical protein Q7J72_01740 [Candidatus Omnitrophota bacterium]|nr:hypothetical protein [Candidatus Omnitrophota bacterium]